MVKSFLIINYIIAYSFSVYGQTNNNSDDCYIIVIDEPSIYPGGIDSMKSFVARNLKYPHTALRDKIEGTVYVEFWIDTSGLTVDHKIIRSVRTDLDDEAIRVSKLIIFSQPAKQKGKPIKYRLTIPFKFELPETKKKETFAKKKKRVFERRKNRI